MNCEAVRPLLAEVAAEAAVPGPVAGHLRSCPECSAELAFYRRMLQELGALRREGREPPPGFLDRLLAELPEAHRRRILARVAGDERFQHAALSVGGAVLGATAIGLLWWRAARRSEPVEAGAAAS